MKRAFSRVAALWGRMAAPILAPATMLALAVTLAACIHGGLAQAEPAFDNPIILQRADPYVELHDGYYYFSATAPEYDRIEIRRAKTIQGLAQSEPKVVWRKHDTGVMGSHIWAPEIHSIDGKWYIYFAAGGAEKVWDIRIYVLENDSANPFKGKWIERGQLKTNWESFSLDSTTFVNKGTRYLVWAQADPKMKPRGNSNLYIAKMNSPTSIEGKQAMLSKPEFAWETFKYRVNEGPAALIHGGKIFLTYSASATDWHYCMGMLTASVDADLLDPKSWTKSPEPVFATSDANGVYGPGHNSFTKTPDGKTDILVYHARSYKAIVGDALHDPNRSTRAQVVHWRPDGTPDFGVPIAGPTAKKP
jgi:GH43 family beta-xylosidase